MIYSMGTHNNIDPNPHNNLGVIYARQGKLDLTILDTEKDIMGLLK